MHSRVTKQSLALLLGVLSLGLQTGTTQAAEEAHLKFSCGHWCQEGKGCSGASWTDENKRTVGGFAGDWSYDVTVQGDIITAVAVKAAEGQSILKNPGVTLLINEKEFKTPSTKLGSELKLPYFRDYIETLRIDGGLKNPVAFSLLQMPSGAKFIPAVCGKVEVVLPTVRTPEKAKVPSGDFNFTCGRPSGECSAGNQCASTYMGVFTNAGQDAGPYSGNSLKLSFQDGKLSGVSGYYGIVTKNTCAGAPIPASFCATLPKKGATPTVPGKIEGSGKITLGAGGFLAPGGSLPVQFDAPLRSYFEGGSGMGTLKFDFTVKADSNGKLSVSDLVHQVGEGGVVFKRDCKAQ